MSKIAAIQMTSCMDVQENLACVQKLLEKAYNNEVGFSVLPEMFPIKGENTKDVRYYHGSN